MKLHRFETLHEFIKQMPDIVDDIAHISEMPEVKTDLQFITQAIESDDCVVPYHAKKAAKMFFTKLMTLIDGKDEDLVCIFAMIQSYGHDYYKLFSVAGSLEDRDDLLVQHYVEFKDKFDNKQDYQSIVDKIIKKDITLLTPTGKYPHYFLTNEDGTVKEEQRYYSAGKVKTFSAQTSPTKKPKAVGVQPKTENPKKSEKAKKTEPSLGNPVLPIPTKTTKKKNG